MNSKLKSFALVSSCLLFSVLAFSYGYYRGYQDKSRISSSIELAVNEAVYEALQQNKPERAKSDLQVVIFSESKNLRDMEKSPLDNFASEFSGSSAGDVSKNLLKADELTKGITFTQVPTQETK